MTREEAINWLIRPIVSSTEIGEFKAKELKAYELAIEALENNDKLAEDLETCLEMYKKKKAEVETLKQTAWIPCSERLPEKSGRYLVTNTYADDVRIVDFNYWDSEHNWWQTEVLNPDTDKDDFNLAWMPLPKPYMGGEEDGNN